MKGIWETGEVLTVQNGRREADEGDEDADEAGAVEVSGDLHTKIGNPMLMNTGGIGVAAVMKGNITAVDYLCVVTDSTEEEGDVGDVDKTTTMATDDHLLIIILIQFLRRTPLTRLHLSL